MFCVHQKELKTPCCDFFIGSLAQSVGE